MRKIKYLNHRVADAMAEAKNGKLSSVALQIYIEHIIAYWEQDTSAIDFNYIMALKKVLKNIKEIQKYFPVEIKKDKDKQTYYNCFYNKQITYYEKRLNGIDLKEQQKNLSDFKLGESTDAFLLWEMVLERRQLMYPETEELKKAISQVKQGLKTYENLIFKKILKKVS